MRLSGMLASSGVLSSLPAGNQRIFTGREFFPHLLSGPFHQGLVLGAAAALSVLAALASLLRGGRYVHRRKPTTCRGPLPSR
jgi:hypothetical protein